MLVCIGALANIAAASTPAGEDQYLEQPPNGGGNNGGAKNNNNFSHSVGSNNGTVTQADVKKAAEKNKKKNEKNKKGDDGSTGGTGAVGSKNTTPPTPPAGQSVATAAKLGPFSRNTALFLIALMVAIALGAVVLRNRNNTVPGGENAGPTSH